MLPKIIDRKDLKGFVESLLVDNVVVAPVRKGEKYVFSEVDTFDEIALDYDTSLLSPKKYFFPQIETVLKFKIGDKPLSEPVAAESPRIIFGIHPCDVAATWLLDEVFKDDPADPNYLDKRRKAILVGLNCRTPCDEFAFCRDMGTHNAAEGFDLMLTDLGDRCFVEVGTKLGESLIVAGAEFTNTTAEDLKARQTWQDEKEKNFTKRIPYDTKFLPEILEQSYDSLVWDAIAQRCFSCGSCNLVCPTCYCFDIRDKVAANAAEGERRRIWDSCQLAEFTQVAGGEVFREERSARLRHRFFRKGKWLLERYGKLGCVGCGRCDRNCLVKINSVEVYTQLAGEPVR
ncbi:MAG: 4Fe-4S dicluster domain-containing protein [Planctomycetota bacterium]|jgi:sulfhydrogenase subunit beta (sulfur reductase)